MAWTDGELAAEVDRYGAELKRDHYDPDTIRTYIDQSRRFLRWRTGAYVPLGTVATGRPTAEGPADTQTLRADVGHYETVLRAAGRMPRTLTTYLGGSKRFIVRLERAEVPRPQQRLFERRSAVSGALLNPARVRVILRAITRDDVLGALANLDQGEFGDFGPPTRYELVYQGRRYPPKAAVGLAARRQIGRPLSHNEFSGGNSRTQANGVLRALGFKIEAFRPIASRPPQAAAAPGSDWSDVEIAVAIAAYFDLLRRQLDGQVVVKRATLTGALERLPGRTRGALEFKLENISAVLDWLELSWLGGYAPAQNYQRRLEDAVLAALVADPSLAARLRASEEDAPPPPAVAQATEDVIVEPPFPQGKETVDRKQPRLARGGWAANHDQANKKLGTDGEQWVVELEREKLRRAGRSDLAGRIDHVALRLGDGYGYDLLSFDAEGHELHIEVKTTKSGRSTPFALTPNELRTSLADPSTFRLYRVFDYGLTASLYILEGDLEPFLELTPTQYSARLKQRVF